jgi:transcriptional regulator with XRE-family HTH domain
MKKYRKMAGISQKKLADLCRISHSHIRQLECGSRTPSFTLLGKLAAALNIPVSFLFSSEEDEKIYSLLKKGEIETELVEKLTENVRVAFSKL